MSARPEGRVCVRAHRSSAVTGADIVVDYGMKVW